MIVQLDTSVDIWLSQTWSNNNHGICGHTFEIIEYYHILKSQYKVGIFLAENIDLESAIRHKYDFTEEEIADILKNTVIADKPKLVRGKNILFVDGGIVNANHNKFLLFDKIIYFACGNKEVKDNEDPKVHILQDNRVYEKVKVNGHNYIKKILFSRLKKPTTQPDEYTYLIYATKNCRNITDYSAFDSFNGKKLVITNEENLPPPREGYTFVVPPVENLFEKFTTYIYTPIERKWDCSPRFLAECEYFDKHVVMYNIDYWQEDHGLYWRWSDINYNFKSLELTLNDDIFRVLKKIL